MTKPTALFLFDESGNMAQPWIEAGFPCICVDTQHEPGAQTDGLLTRVGADVLEYLPPRTTYAFAAAFPPCTDLAISGAQYFQDKGLAALADSLRLVNRARKILEWTGAPWMIENPVGTLSTYWRTPDYSFDPCDFGGYLTPPGDAYTKKTHLWTGGGICVSLAQARRADPHQQSGRMDAEPRRQERAHQAPAQRHAQGIRPRRLHHQPAAARRAAERLTFSTLYHGH